jgi:PAS domain S-box-containing protein
MLIMNDQVNILMVDDQPAKLLSYEAILGELGENLIKATSGREALEHLLKNDVAVVLMDVSMPEMDGFELAEIIRQHPRFQRTAIIFISAVHLTDLDKLKGYQRGAVDYISVPVVPELLRAKVSVFSELHRKSRQLERLNRELEDRVLQRTEELRKSETQIRKLNDELTQRLAELETIMQVLPIGIAVAQDPECRIVTTNAALSNLLGTDPDQNLSLTGAESGALPFTIYRDGVLISPRELPIRHAAATGQVAGMAEFEIRRGSGTAVHVLSNAIPLFDDSGQVRGAVTALVDVSARKHMEDMLRERAELLDLATEAVIVRDIEERILFWNSGAEDLYGWQRDEVLGKNLHQVLKTQFSDSLEHIDATLLAVGRWQGNLRQRTKEGREITVACRKALKDEGPGARRVVLEINRDITAQLQAEDALRKSERLAAMGRMAGIIAHEINNPLEAITNAFFLLREHPSLNEEARYYAKLAGEELERIAHITRQTLSFYRESQQAVPLSIAGVLDDVLELQSRPLRLHGIKADRDYRTKGQIVGFPGELKQVFLNLVGNAIQAMPEGGRLRVSVHESIEPKTRRPGVRVKVSDTGTGIQPEDARRLFEPFFTTKSVKGTGLGLWISKGILQKYEGSIRFRSLRLDGTRATCFTVFLPETGTARKDGVVIMHPTQEWKVQKALG